MRNEKLTPKQVPEHDPRMEIKVISSGQVPQARILQVTDYETKTLRKKKRRTTNSASSASNNASDSNTDHDHQLDGCCVWGFSFMIQVLGIMILNAYIPVYYYVDSSRVLIMHLFLVGGSVGTFEVIRLVFVKADHQLYFFLLTSVIFSIAFPVFYTHFYNPHPLTHSMYWIQVFVQSVIFTCAPGAPCLVFSLLYHCYKLLMIQQEARLARNRGAQETMA